MTIFESIMQSPLVAKAGDYYNGLAPREQLALKIMAAFLGPVILVFALLLPSADYMYSALERYQGALENQRWIEANRDAFAGGSSTATREPGQSLFGIANSTSKGFRISFKRYEPAGANALNLWIDNVSFNNLVLWLERLDKRYGVSVREIAVERLQTEGQVNVRLVLQG